MVAPVQGGCSCVACNTSLIQAHASSGLSAALEAPDKT